MKKIMLFDCPKKGASMKQSSNKKSREATAFLYERLSRDDNLEDVYKRQASYLAQYT